MNSSTDAYLDRQPEPLESALREIFARIAEVPATFPASAHMREELQLDSIRLVELIFEIEQTFQLTFPETRYAEATTFAELVTLVRSLARQA